MTIVRAVLAAALGLGLVAAPSSAPAQQAPGKVGYVEGQNIAIEHRFPEFKYERLPGLAAELVRLKVDVIVASLARPGGNLTGLSTISPELVGKQLGQPNHARAGRQAEDAARALGMQVQVLEARTPSEIEAAFAAMRAQRAGGVLVLRDAVFRAQGALGLTIPPSLLGQADHVIQ